MNAHQHDFFEDHEIEIYFDQLEASLLAVHSEIDLRGDSSKVMNFNEKDALSCMRHCPKGFPEKRFPNVLFFLVAFFGKRLNFDKKHDIAVGESERQDSEGLHDVLIEHSYLPRDQWSVDWMIEDAFRGLDKRMSIQDGILTLTLFHEHWGFKENQLRIISVDDLGEYWKMCLNKRRQEGA